MGAHLAHNSAVGAASERWAPPNSMQDSPRLCGQLSIPKQYWDIKSSEMPAFVDIPYTKAINVGETVCIRVVVPKNPYNASMVFTPFSNTPWDSVLLDLVGVETGISIPVDLKLASDVRNYDKHSTHVYEADVQLRDVDVYRPEGYVEYRDALWNAEMPLDPQPFNPEPLYVSAALEVSALDRYGNSTFSLSKYMDLPLCAESNPEGRWVAGENLPFSASTLPHPDNHNRVWLPYNCRLQHISYQSFAQCLIDKYPVVHFFGDSNMRRALKKITTLGEWCSTPEEQATAKCLCEDYRDSFERFNVNSRNTIVDMDPIGGGHMPNGSFSLSAPPANKSRVFLRKWEGLVEAFSLDWKDAFRDTIGDVFGHPQVIVLSLTNWDSAFSARAVFLRDVELLLGFIESGYRPSTEIIIRTGQYYCCRSDTTPWKRRYSRLRNKAFDREIISAFHNRFNGTRSIRVWDVAAISEHRPYHARNQSLSCPSNHVRSEIVEVENQVLFNYMCNG
ncbi:hypothetical protein GGI25_003547 [Coemansia spiralis]|uniref:Uncharacterized protein n=2 Tax=Coemansia TaxID=4863 RepID=A0A9W8G708_9FUNG|nr:hypothetical protein BX070DRAFT_263754 [Coemansia spiralis]KAJ1990437.1 hypothetical protein EDC05_004081 [Coemansia umbellata]KAJ2622076.1 hypothetical protein GGI26_003518 [Coemansia sp. RSA 1358]KAJ2676512.1 hypothetical protein GGI25_003547 [Coemansia spiralis]